MKREPLCLPANSGVWVACTGGCQGLPRPWRRGHPLRGRAASTQPAALAFAGEQGHSGAAGGGSELSGLRARMQRTRRQEELQEMWLLLQQIQRDFLQLCSPLLQRGAAGMGSPAAGHPNNLGAAVHAGWPCARWARVGY